MFQNYSLYFKTENEINLYKNSVNSLNYISDSIYVTDSNGKGRGIFTIGNLKKNTIIEIAPVIVMSKKDRAHIDQTLLHDYIFEWGDQHNQCCMALGYVPLYNHSYRSNCEYEMNFKKQIITVKTIKAIKAGEELTINYNGDWNNAKPVWFDVS
ncbi:MAG TPA: SET domain-containing protein [Flavisolibacter sp.]|jgi:SET domain-containing protein|nr:SET domain-containing protein [Flavisolibacter sp.]